MLHLLHFSIVCVYVCPLDLCCISAFGRRKLVKVCRLLQNVPVNGKKTPFEKTNVNNSCKWNGKTRQRNFNLQDGNILNITVTLVTWVVPFFFFLLLKTSALFCIHPDVFTALYWKCKNNSSENPKNSPFWIFPRYKFHLSFSNYLKKNLNSRKIVYDNWIITKYLYFHQISIRIPSNSYEKLLILHPQMAESLSFMWLSN